ncbi:hypothetical protein BV22DRAFT_1029448 [Leucogyrophana mollusca]|uniref:Uncharacterized protein n=1 Tax=Leucogyrophana mollusca TaxID=85980 RepID=A0ACB8BVT6_9AGAM|nr:hypothetical protein BV22DRAFT_1029448 [Leucogyrophana mollusca]
MRPYAIYEHPDFTSPSTVSTNGFSFQKLAAALTVVAASSAAVYEIVIHTGAAQSRSVYILCCASHK